MSAVDPAVVVAVRAWGAAPSMEAAAQALTKARRALAPELRPALVHEVAAVAAELLLEQLTRTDGLDEGASPVEVEGVELHPMQAQRLGAWLEDQKLACDALGLDPRTWQAALDRAMVTLGTTAEGSTPGGRKAVDVGRATALIGTEKSSRAPSVGASKGGLQSLLDARSFDAKPKKRR